MYFLVKFTHKLASNAWIGLEKPIWDEVTKPMGSSFHYTSFALVIVKGAQLEEVRVQPWPIENT